MICEVEKCGKDKFVLKPNQEGGSNNYFGIEAYDKLKKLTCEERKNYVLTRLVTPQTNNCVIIRPKTETEFIT